jgi:hypothetical protein
MLLESTARLIVSVRTFAIAAPEPHARFRRGDCVPIALVLKQEVSYSDCLPALQLNKYCCSLSVAVLGSACDSA